MTGLIALENEEMQDEEEQEMGSLNHSITQAQITTLLGTDKRFRTMVELSLDASQLDLSQFGLKAKEELKPDICIYPRSLKGNKRRDILKMPNMPLLAIEIISPRQGNEEIITKFEAYFALGVKSCWLVAPMFESVTLYSQIDKHKIFDTQRDTQVIDEVIDIRLPIQEIFDW